MQHGIGGSTTAMITLMAFSVLLGEQIQGADVGFHGVDQHLSGTRSTVCFSSSSAAIVEL